VARTLLSAKSYPQKRGRAYLPLNRNIQPKPGVAGEINFPHTPRSQRCKNFIGASFVPEASAMCAGIIPALHMADVAIT